MNAPAPEDAPIINEPENDPTSKNSEKTTEIGISHFQAKLDEIWSQYDTNETGVLEKDQALEFLRASMQKISNAPPTDEVVEEKFRETDLNGDGKLNREEVLQYLMEYAS